MGNFISCNDCSTLTLPSIGATRCGETFGQVQIAAFIKLDDLPKFGESTSQSDLLIDTNIVTKANWVSVIQSGSSSTTAKVQMSPLLYNPSFTAGDARTWGGGNATLDGVEYFLGLNPTTAEFELRFAKQSVVKKMKELHCLAQQGKLGVMFFNGNGEVMGTSGTITVSSTATDATLPIPISSLIVKDKQLGGYEEPDYNAMTMTFAPNWSDTIKITALTDGWCGKELLS